MANRETSLIECNQRIVDILRKELHPALNGFRRSKKSLHDYVLRSLLQSPANTKLYTARCQRACDAILDIWSCYGAEVENSVRESKSLKYVLPAPWTFPEMASRMGCYTDLILVPDQTRHMMAIASVTVDNLSEYLVNYLPESVLTL